MQLRATTQQSRLWLDPRTKFFLLFFIGFYSFSAPTPGVEAAIMGVVGVLLLFSGQWRTAAKLAAVYTVMLMLDLLVSSLLSGGFSTLFYTIVKPL